MVQCPELGSPTWEAQAWHQAGALRPCQPHGQVRGDFLAFWEVWGLLPVFSRCSVGVVSHVDVFLMYLWGGRWSPRLTPLPSCRSPENCVFKGIGSFILGNHICGHRVVHIFLYYPFNVFVICSDVSSFISDISICFPFFPRLAWLEIYQFYCSFQRTRFWFHSFSLLISCFQFH